jgi:hypothetical protein
LEISAYPQTLVTVECHIFGYPARALSPPPSFGTPFRPAAAAAIPLAAMRQEAENWIMSLFLAGRRAMVAGNRDAIVHPRHFSRYVLAGIVAVLIIVYIGAVVAGKIDENQRIDTSIILLLLFGIGIIALLVSPQTFSAISAIELAGLKLELKNIRERQNRQLEQMELFNFVLPLLLSDKEREYLQQVSKQNKSYSADHDLRAAIRRVANMGLVERVPGKKVADMKNNSSVNLAEFVSLTGRGRDWVSRIEEAENSN